MIKKTKEGSKEPLEVRIKVVRNGVCVCAYHGDERTDYEYVYKDVKSALKEVESIFSVLKEDQPKPDMDDLDKEEEALKKGEY